MNTEWELNLPSIISSVMYCSNYTENAVLSLLCAVTLHICDYYHKSVCIIHCIYEKKRCIKWQQRRGFCLILTDWTHFIPEAILISLYYNVSFVQHVLCGNNHDLIKFHCGCDVKGLFLWLQSYPTNWYCVCCRSTQRQTLAPLAQMNKL